MATHCGIRGAQRFGEESPRRKWSYLLPSRRVARRHRADVALNDDEYDSRVLARVASERTRERFRNAINAGLAVVRAAAINAGLDAEALAESVDAQITEAINRNVAETISDLTGDAAEAQ